MDAAHYQAVAFYGRYGWQHDSIPMIRNEEFRRLHERHSWLPFTQMKGADPLFVRRGDGVRLELEDGRTVLDGIGSWWVNVYGHGNPAIRKAIADQAGLLEQVIYANFVHEPGLRLAGRLSEKTGHNLPRVFYSDNGSTAVEIGIKMAYQYFRNRGDSRDVIVCLEGGYHGDTFGAMSAGGRSVFHSVFEPLLFRVTHLPVPSCSHAGMNDEGIAGQELERAIAALNAIFDEQGDRIACLLLEPMIQGAGGMNLYHPLYVKEARRLCSSYGVPLIADEVFSGCGRTGDFFAFERAGVWPDVIALSKGLTGGFLPFAATLATEEIYEGFKGEGARTLYHGHSMTGSPLGCAAALAALDLYESLSVKERLAVMEERSLELLSELRSGAVGDLVTRERALGSVAAFDLRRSIPYGSPFSSRFTSAAIDEGLFVRPLGGTIYLAPAFTTTEEEHREMFRALERALQKCRPLL